MGIVIKEYKEYDNTLVLEITVGHQTFSDQNCWIYEQFWFWSDKMSRQIVLELICTLLANFMCFYQTSVYNYRLAL